MSDPQAIAFTVQGCGVTAAQRDAALAVMVGTFRTAAVSGALAKAGVRDQPGKSYTVERAGDRLLQAERKAGRIRARARRGIPAR